MTDRPHGATALVEREPTGGWGSALPRVVVIGLVAVVLVASAAGVLAAPLDPQRGAALHELLEFFACLTAIFTAVLAVVHFQVQRDVTVPIVAAALAAAGTVDGVHAVAMTGLFDVRDVDGFVGWSWVLSRSYAVSVLLVGASLALVARRAERSLALGTFFTALGAVAGLFWLADAPTLASVHGSGWLARPPSLVPLGLLVAGVPILNRLHGRLRGLFSHALLVSLIPHVATEVMMGTSRAPYDGAFHAAHVLKVVAYLVPFVGLCLAHVRSGRRERAALLELEEARRQLLEKTWSLEASLLDQQAALEEARQAEDDAVALAWRLGRSNRELQRFAAVAAHDLQEPLRKLQAFSERLDRRFGAEIPEGARTYLERMNKSAARMHQLVADLLSFSRVTTQAKPFAEVDLEELVDDVLDDLELRIQETGARIHVTSLPVVQGDVGQLRQVLQNLISNALKFQKPEVPPTVRVSASLLDEERSPLGVTAWQISIADEGIGFDEKYLDRIFEIFQRLHGRDDYEGTGIGLAICRKVAERHGGLLGASSRPGEGATFRLVLPLEPPAPSAAAAEDHLPPQETL